MFLNFLEFFIFKRSLLNSTFLVYFPLLLRPFLDTLWNEVVFALKLLYGRIGDTLGTLWGHRERIGGCIGVTLGTYCACIGDALGMNWGYLR